MCSNSVRSPNQLKKRAVTRLNLQNNSKTLRQFDSKGTTESHSIPLIINGRVPRKVSTTTSYKRSTLLREGKSNTVKWYVTPSHTKHNLLLLGDSHTRSLAGRISYSLDNSFSVTGITKSNADTKGITSPSHFAPDNLTKQDTVIFYGGTRDINKNESKRGLCSLKELAQRTSNTNVIILEDLLRYDLSLSSCVNTEVRLFNKRM